MDNIANKFAQALAGVRENLAFAEQKKLNDLQRRKLQFELENLNQPVPEGFVNVRGKAVKDPTYFNPEEMKAKARAQYEAFGMIPQDQRSEMQFQAGPAIIPGSKVPSATQFNQGAKTGQFDMMPTKATVKSPLGSTTYENVGNKKREELNKLQSKQMGDIQDQTRNFQKITNLMQRTVAQKKAQLSESGGGGRLNPEYIGSKVKAWAKVPGAEATDAYGGQTTETSMAMNSLLTGQNRVIEGVLAQIKATLPELADTAPYAANKVAQSLYNSYGIWKALQKAGITKEILDGYSDEELADPNSKINMKIKSLPVEPLTPEEMKAFEPFVQEVLNTPEAKKFQFDVATRDIPSFNTPEEAEASGYKGIALIAGRKARID